MKLPPHGPLLAAHRSRRAPRACVQRINPEVSAYKDRRFGGDDVSTQQLTPGLATAASLADVIGHAARASGPLSSALQLHACQQHVHAPGPRCRMSSGGHLAG